MDFGNIRSLLQQTPTTHNFIRLCKMLTPWSPEHYVAELEPYLTAHLESWPDDVRLLPPQWMKQWSVWGDDPRVTLCRAARCDVYSACESFLRDAPSWVRALSLFRVEINADYHFAHFANLQHLHMRRVFWRTPFELVRWPALVQLTIQQCSFDAAPSLHSQTLQMVTCLNQTKPPLHQWAVPETLTRLAIDEAGYTEARAFYDRLAQDGVQLIRQ